MTFLKAGNPLAGRSIFWEAAADTFFPRLEYFLQRQKNPERLFSFAKPVLSSNMGTARTGVFTFWQGSAAGSNLHWGQTAEHHFGLFLENRVWGTIGKAVCGAEVMCMNRIPPKDDSPWTRSIVLRQDGKWRRGLIVDQSGSLHRHRFCTKEEMVPGEACKKNTMRWQLRVRGTGSLSPGEMQGWGGRERWFFTCLKN